MTETQTIREVAHGSPDYGATVTLRDAILRAPLGLRFDPDELAAERDSYHIACFRDGRLVGCLVLRPGSDGDVKMRQVAVATDCQGRGIGSALVAYSEALARELGFVRMTLHARETAVPFYAKLGYAKVGRQFVEVTLPHWEMVKRLTSER